MRGSCCMREYSRPWLHAQPSIRLHLAAAHQSNTAAAAAFTAVRSRQSTRHIWTRQTPLSSQPLVACLSTALAVRAMATSSREQASKPKASSVPAPSASVVVVSPENEILLLHRVQNGTFASAHVFPGGNLSSFHEGELIPGPESPDRHMDGPAYRLAAIRETYEESGVLLAQPLGDCAPNALLQIGEDVKASSRPRVANKELKFDDWLSSVGGKPDAKNLIPFTRWITPTNLARRFTTQMYLYLLPLTPDTVGDQSDTHATAKTDSKSKATADRSEVMTAEYAAASTWLQRAWSNDIILFPPQLYILSLLAPILRSTADVSGGGSAMRYRAERQRLKKLLEEPAIPGKELHWEDLVISPRPMAVLPDKRVVLALDKPGPELKGSGRVGDNHRVVLLKSAPGAPRNVELKLREEIEALLQRDGSSEPGRRDPKI